MFRLLLPPNLADAAKRDAVAVRTEIDLSRPPSPEWLPALALLQRWSGTPSPPRLLQLTRVQLRSLVDVLAGQPVFAWVNGATSPSWQGSKLNGVSEHLEPPPSVPSHNAGSSTAITKIACTADRKSISSGAPMTVDGSEHFLAITLPSRENPHYESVSALLKETGFTLEPSNRKWWLRDRHKSLNFLAAHLSRLRHEIGAQFSANFEKNIAHLRATEIGTDVTEVGENFTVTLGVRAGSASDAELRAALATGRGYLESGGKVFLFDAAQLTRLAQAQRTLSGNPQASLAPRQIQPISRARTAEAHDVLAELSPGFQPPAAWRNRSDALRNLSALVPAAIPQPLDTQLRPYQRLGVAWLAHLQRHQLGGILADEMGLGKTLQALALLAALARTEGLRKLSPNLVVAPASLLENWRREATRFVPHLRTVVHHADQRITAPAEFTAYDLVITSYGTLARDQLLFTAVEFATVIADEAQHIKNRRSQNAAALRALRARSRFLLTGTPLENSLDDLRSLFEFLLPGYLTRVPTGIRGDERAWFDERLRAQTAPYILRRTKRAVAPELPAKLEQTIWCELTAEQGRLYQEVQQKSERELFDLEAGGASEAAMKFAALTQLLRLRQICCDPRLVAPALDADTSAKLGAFRELIAEAIDDGHRTLVFSQFTSLLNLLRSELETQQIAYCYLDGSMPARARQTEVDRFQSSTDIPLFLLSLKAGGTGLNLTAADTVVHFDPWWNPAAEAQATDRAHRIGQTKVVTSYKLIVAGTVEEKVLGLQEEKRALLANVFEASDAAAARLSLADLKSLLTSDRISR